jgi:hypothetical protein
MFRGICPYQATTSQDNKILPRRCLLTIGRKSKAYNLISIYELYQCCQMFNFISVYEHPTLCPVQSDGQIVTFWKYNFVHYFAIYHPNIHKFPLEMYVKTHIEKREELAMGIVPEVTLKYQEDNKIPNSDDIQEFLITRK